MNDMRRIQVAVNKGPLPFSATDFDEEDKVLVRQLRCNGEVSKHPDTYRVHQEIIMALVKKYNDTYRGHPPIFDLIDLILREEGTPLL